MQTPTGARRGELTALQWENIDLDSGKATIRASLSQTKCRVFLKSTKTERARAVHLSPMALAALRAQKAQQARDKLRFGHGYDSGGFVFTNEAGERYTPMAITDTFGRIARRASVSTMRLHSPRHIAAAWLINEGVDVVTVAGILGHAATSTTLNTYSHVVDDSKRAAVSKIEERLTRQKGSA